MSFGLWKQLPIDHLRPRCEDVIGQKGCVSPIPKSHRESGIESCSCPEAAQQRNNELSARGIG